MINKVNSTLKSMLNETMDEKGDKWDEYVEATLFSYRTSQHE